MVSCLFFYKHLAPRKHMMCYFSILVFKEGQTTNTGGTYITMPLSPSQRAMSACFDVSMPLKWLSDVLSAQLRPSHWKWFGTGWMDTNPAMHRWEYKLEMNKMINMSSSLLFLSSPMYCLLLISTMSPLLQTINIITYIKLMN